MARITVEDSLEKVNNRFELVLLASRRARDLMMTGQEPTVSWGNDKATVVALREIAEGGIDGSYESASSDDMPKVAADRDYSEVFEMADPDAALIAALSGMADMPVSSKSGSADEADVDD